MVLLIFLDFSRIAGVVPGQRVPQARVRLSCEGWGWGQGPGQGNATSARARQVLKGWMWYQLLPGGLSVWLSFLNTFSFCHDAERSL